MAEPSARTRLDRINDLRHPTLNYRLRVPVRLTDGVIAQLRAAGARQREGFTRILRTVLDEGAGRLGAGHQANSMEADDGADGDGRDAAMRILDSDALPQVVNDQWADGRSSDEDVFGHGGEMDLCDGSIATATDPRGSLPVGADGEARELAPVRRPEEPSDGDTPTAEGGVAPCAAPTGGRGACSQSEDDAIARSAAASRRMKALRDRIVAKTIGAAAEAAGRAEVPQADSMRPRDDRPAKSRCTLAPRGREEDALPPQTRWEQGRTYAQWDQSLAIAAAGQSVADATCTSGEGDGGHPNGGGDLEMHDVHVAASCTSSPSISRGEPPHAARDRLLRQLLGMDRSRPPQGTSTRERAASGPGGGAAGSTLSRAQTQGGARGGKRDATGGGGSADDEPGIAPKRRRLRGKQPPRSGVG